MKLQLQQIDSSRTKKRGGKKGINSSELLLLSHSLRAFSITSFNIEQTFPPRNDKLEALLEAINIPLLAVFLAWSIHFLPILLPQNRSLLLLGGLHPFSRWKLFSVYYRPGSNGKNVIGMERRSQGGSKIRSICGGEEKGRGARPKKCLASSKVEDHFLSRGAKKLSHPRKEGLPPTFPMILLLVQKKLFHYRCSEKTEPIDSRKIIIDNMRSMPICLLR